MGHHVDSSQPLEYQTEEGRLKIFGFWIFLGAEIMLKKKMHKDYCLL